MSNAIQYQPSRTPGRAFTLIELLVVISIIGVLAGLTVGLGGMASRKSKEARIRTEMNKLINAIENYKSTMGFYPPDHQAVDPADARKTVGVPSPNQLFYELSGTIFLNNQFYLIGTQEGLPAATISSVFGSSGIANSVRAESLRDLPRAAKDVKFTESFKASQVQRISDNPPVQVLAVPAKGPANRVINYRGVAVNPWLYVSTSPTNNAERFDLWTETLIGGKIIRFSNWEKDPVVLR